ncbi:threonine--tRNA ligase [Methanopyrus kandleri]
MRLLFIHADEMSFEARQKTKIAEEEPPIKEAEVEDCLVVFAAVQEADEENPKAIAEAAVEEIEDVAGELKVDRIVLYPYAHLADDLASPDVAVDVLKRMEGLLKERGYEVVRAPFGWYKAFRLACKGHPLSELSRTVTPEAAEEAEEKIESEFLVYMDGELIPVEEVDLSELPEDFRHLAMHELGEERETGDEEPAHVKLMREKEICDHEPAADVGHVRWYPKGHVIRRCLAEYVENLMADLGAAVVETPVMYDLSEDAIREHADKFGERQYRMRAGNRALMLRYAACFGAFRLLADTTLSRRHLPLKIYELSQSFRLEQSGEVVGLKRLRAFTMPDLHTVCADMDEAVEEFLKQAKLCLEVGLDLGLEYEVVFRTTEKFLKGRKEVLEELAKAMEKAYGDAKPVLVEVLPERKHYWECKVDFAFIDSLGRPIENPTVQIDVESGKRFGITYADESGDERHPVILHCSPTGSLERVICAILEGQYKRFEQEGKLPTLPTWLSPVQVRVIPVSEKVLEEAEKVFEELKSEGFRVDLDDRDEPVGRKIRDAGEEWVPYVVVIGEEEVKKGTLSVTIREESTLKEQRREEMTLEKLVERLERETEGKPRVPLTIPDRLSRRPRFGR